MDAEDRRIGLLTMGFLGYLYWLFGAAGSLYNSPIFPYPPVLLPSSSSVLYILLIHTFPLEPTVIVHGRSLEPYP